MFGPSARLVPVVAWCVGFALLVSAARAQEDDLAAALYVRTDDDETTVISPHARKGTQLGEATRLDVTYAADVWTSASIDVRTSASVQKVTEQRDELDLSVSHELTDLALTGAYRFSTEHDYTSHGVTAAGAYSLADNAATLALSVTLLGDTVGRAGDPAFARDLFTLNTRLSFTQVIDPEMFVTGTYELSQLDGYLSSPYRFVGIGGTGEGCLGAPLCLPEHVPGSRTRHALALLARRAFGDPVSLGATYRFYVDGWGLQSHTLVGELGLTLAEGSLVSLRYRFYKQTGVDFYLARYANLPSADAYTTRDRELSPMGYQRVAAELQQGVPLEGGDERLIATFGVAGAFYRYDDFIGLASTRALEVTTALVLEL